MSVSNLKMPESVILDETSYTNNSGKFILQPLERGFGVTLGNIFTFRRSYYCRQIQWCIARIYYYRRSSWRCFRNNSESEAGKDEAFKQKAKSYNDFF